MMDSSHSRWWRRCGYLFDLIIALVCTYVFCLLTGLLSEWGQWHSPEVHYQLQVRSFMRGTLALQPGPFFGSHDWAPGLHGLYQLWGLGIPLLLWPLNVLARFFGASYFPEYVFFAGLHLLVCLVLLRAVRCSTERPESSVFLSITCKFQQIAVMSFIMLSPALVQLVHVRFQIYEQAVFISCLWSLFLFGILLLFYQRPHRWNLNFLALASGFAPFIRVTGFFYGAVTMLFALVLAHKAQMRRKYLVFAAILFLTGPLLLLYLNHIRFGAPFEFGYSLNNSGIIHNDYALRFGYPFQDESLLNAVRELLGALFYVTNLNYHQMPKAGLHAWQSEALRFREFYFLPFDSLAAILILLFWISAFLLVLFHRRGLPTFFRSNPWGAFAAPWSLLASCMLFLFYLYSPSIVSRYMMDFFPSFFVALSGLVMSVFYFTHSISNRRGYVQFLSTVGIVMLMAGWTFHSLTHYFHLPSPGYHFTRGIPVQALIERLAGYERGTGDIDFGKVPEKYSCLMKPQNVGLLYNRRGWDWQRSCRVHPITVAFLRPSPCIRLTVRHNRRNITRAELIEQIGPVRVRSNLQELHKVKQEILGSGARLTYCEMEKLSRPDWNMQMVSVAWVPRQLLTTGYTDLKLISVEVALRE